MIDKLNAEEAIEREELAERIASTYMAGMTPSTTELDRCKALGLSPERIREAVDVCYDSEDIL